MPPSESSVDANGIRLHCLEWGDDGPPVVLLHPTGFLARLWEPIAQGLSRRFHVYAYDARGHGDSDKPPLPAGSRGEIGTPVESYTWDRFVVDFHGFLDTLDLRGVIAVGHSMGGATAAHLAATHSEYVSAAVVIEPIVFPPTMGSHERKEQLVSGAAKRRTVWSSREEMVRSYRSRKAFAGWREDVLRLYAEHGTFPREDGRFELKCPAEIEASVFAGGPSPETWDRLPDIRCPLLVLRGQHTEPHLAWAAESVAERAPNARLVTVPGASHFLPMERPDAVLAEIRSFLGEGGPK